LDHSNSLPLGQKSCSNAPLIIVLKHLCSKTTFHKEICREDTLNLLLKILLKEFFTNKGEILSCKSIKPCKKKTEKKKLKGIITPEQEINLVQIPHPSKATFKFPPSRAQCTVECPGYAWEGGMLKFQIDRRGQGV